MVRDSAVASVGCDSLVVRSVEIQPQRPAFRGHMARWRRLARSVGLHHTTTRPSIVRRFVTLDPGQPCTEFRRAESERILRAQPYLATARVRTLPDGAGGAIVDVETIDEVPVLIGGKIHRGQLADVTLGNENLFGLAMRLEVRAERRAAYRDGYGASLTHHQLLGKPYTLTLEQHRHPVGDEWRAEAGHAFLTDLQRIAWHAGMSGRHEYLPLRRLGEDEETTLPVRRSRYDIGGVLRFGPPGRLGLLGGVLTGERVTPAARAVVVTDSGFRVMPEDEAVLGYRPFRTTRPTLVAGLRALRFTTARGFDALDAEQDLARGLQVGVTLGRGIRAFRSDGDDVLLGGDLFAAAGGRWSYLAMRLEGEGRRPLGTTRWDGVIGSGRAAWYLKQAPRWTLIVSAEGAGAWHSRLPVGLSLADRDGVRGMSRDQAPVGTRRLVSRIEQRWSAGALRFGDVGFAAFADAGRLWAGDVSYASSTGTAVSTGVSILAAVPRGAQRLWRLDLATPVREGRTRLQVRLSSSDRTRTFWQEPEKIARARSGAGLSEIFSWP